MAAEKPLLAWLKQCCHRLRSTTRVGSRLLTPAVWWFHTQFAGPRLILSEPQEPERKPSCHPSHPFTFIIYHNLSSFIRPYQATSGRFKMTGETWWSHWVATDCHGFDFEAFMERALQILEIPPELQQRVLLGDNRRNHGVDPLGEHSCFFIFIRAKTW